MTDLSNFSQEERSLIISLPYRVGVWISNSDDNENTSMDNKRERQTLAVVISKMAKAHRKMPFAASVMHEVEKAKSHWQSWGQQAEEKTVLQDVQKAVEIGRSKLSKAEVTQYKQAVWNIGLSVAQAYGEQIDPDNEMHINRFFNWMGSFMGAPSLRKAPENMSMSEKTALKKLRAVLKG